MMSVKTDLLTKIENEVKNELLEITNKAKEKANKIYEIHKEELNRNLTSKISSEKREVLDRHDQKLREAKRGVDLAVDRARYEVVEQVFLNTKNLLLKELDNNLLDFVVNKFNEYNITSNKLTIAVNEKNFESYGKQLGFDSKTNELTKLNERLPKTEFSLIKDNKVPNGILFIGPDYDINLTVDSIVELLKQESLTDVFKELFTDER